MNKNRLILTSLISALLFCSTSNASSLKASGAEGVHQYQDFGLIGKWSLKDENNILTSAQNTKSSGSITNEYKLGYDSKISEVTSYDLNGYYRTEPGNTHVIGFQPEFSFDYDSLIFKDLSTEFTMGLDLSRSTTETQVTRLRTISQGFTTGGISLGVTQEFFEGFKASLGASFFRYTQLLGKVPPNAKKLINLLATDRALSTSGNPEKTFTFGLSWDWAEKWSSSYSLSKTKTHFDGLTTIYSSLGIDHTFSNRWAAGLAYSWSSGASSAGSLDATYSW